MYSPRTLLHPCDTEPIQELELNSFELMSSESDEMPVLDLFVFAEDVLPSHIVLSCQVPQTTSFASFLGAFPLLE